ncbi:MAG: hypothetical protein BGO67_01840 [Alphaproteobacteria bacterium 41-28]|nr:MAG: hypothetical protein BGO67_01840 [Alphaproteobacteria bacterium 41-28]
MLIISIILFLIAAGFGLVVLTSILQNKPTPKCFVYTHGGVAAIALLMVIYYVFEHPDHAPIASLVLFLIAAAGGFTLFFIDFKGKKIPKWLALVHPVIAVCGVLALAVFILGQV